MALVLILSGSMVSVVCSNFLDMSFSCLFSCSLLQCFHVTVFSNEHGMPV